MAAAWMAEQTAYFIRRRLVVADYRRPAVRPLSKTFVQTKV
jgi:hypothetical protein